MFVGPVCNPISEARLEDGGKSINSLANRLGVSKQYISRAEHGTYSSLNNDLVKYGSARLQITPGDFVRRYKAFQHATRKNTIEDLNPRMLTRGNSNAPGYEIFLRWRSDYWNSITEFSNSFCIHPEIVHAYEDGVRDEMPMSIRHILTELGIMDLNWTDKSNAVKSASTVRDIRQGPVNSTEVIRRTRQP